METITLIAANILLLLIVAVGVCVERRVTRLEMTRSRQALWVRELRREVDELRCVLDAQEDEQADAEALSAKVAERRFTEGVASILGYGLHAVGKETENDENAGE